MKNGKPVLRSFVLFFGGVFFFSLLADSNPGIRFVGDYISFTQISALPVRYMPEMEAWEQNAPYVQEISIPREGGVPDQPALWYHSGSASKKPLLLVLHSWSADYRQYTGIPYAVFARKNDWIFICPNFRGEFNSKEASASENAIQDVADALAYARAHALVDEERIYVAGFSGGAMMALVMAGRYPEQYSAVLAWVPVYDLNDWYDALLASRQHFADRYRADIEASCGGNPGTEPGARQECVQRSPSSYLGNARGKETRFFISSGVQDRFVPPSHAIRAYNDLAEKGDTISEADYRFVDEAGTLPEGLGGEVKQSRFFEEAGLPVVFWRASGNATLVLFDGGHDMVYNAGLEWLSIPN